jgi:hypothetical protein
MKTGDQPIAESKNKRNTIAFCAPAKKKMTDQNND